MSVPGAQPLMTKAGLILALAIALTGTAVAEPGSNEIKTAMKKAAEFYREKVANKENFRIIEDSSVIKFADVYVEDLSCFQAHKSLVNEELHAIVPISMSVSGKS